MCPTAIQPQQAYKQPPPRYPNTQLQSDRRQAGQPFCAGLVQCTLPVSLQTPPPRLTLNASPNHDPPAHPRPTGAAVPTTTDCCCRLPLAVTLSVSPITPTAGRRYGHRQTSPPTLLVEVCSVPLPSSPSYDAVCPPDKTTPCATYLSTLALRPSKLTPETHAVVTVCCTVCRSPSPQSPQQPTHPSSHTETGQTPTWSRQQECVTRQGSFDTVAVAAAAAACPHTHGGAKAKPAQDTQQHTKHAAAAAAAGATGCRRQQHNCYCSRSESRQHSPAAAAELQRCLNTTKHTYDCCCCCRRHHHHRTSRLRLWLYCCCSCHQEKRTAAGAGLQLRTCYCDCLD